jgi:hypothetical protein
MVDSLINQAEIDAYNASLDFIKYPETGLPPVTSTTVSSVLAQNTPISQNSSMVVQAFDSSGKPEKIIDEVAQRAENFAKAFSGGQASTGGSSSGGPTTLSPDMVAMKQKGYLQEKGFFGDQSMTNENAAFNAVVQIAAALTQPARSLSTTVKTTPRSKYNNYYLYQSEKELLRRKAIEIASIGIIPYDVIEEFLYILVTVDNYDDMFYIACVVGIYELDNINIIREPVLILSLKNLYKVGYLANGVASINMQYGQRFDYLAAADHTSNPLNTLLGAAGSRGPIQQFPTVAIAASLLTDITKQIGLTTALTSLPGFGGSSFNSLSSVGKLAQMANLSTIAGQTSNLNAMVSSTTSVLQQSGVESLKPIIGLLSSLTRQTRDMSNFTTQISSVSTIAASAGKVGDIGNQMNKINSMATNITSLAGNISSLISKIASPGNIGPGAGTMLTQTGGYIPSGITTEQSIGQRIPPSVTCKNPMMTPPGFSGKAFFGEGAAAHGAVDQMFCKRIGAFPSNQNGSGNQSFGLQNFGSFGGTTSLLNMVSRIIIGTNNPPTSGALSDHINAKTNDLANLLNVPTTSYIESRRSDNSIPFMTAMGAVLVDDTKSPFSIDEHSSGWKLAASVGNDAQRYNPQYLSTCASSL